MVRVRLGHDVLVRGETQDGLVLESTRRLRPGQLVELTRSALPARGRPAQVLTWRVVQLGTDGLMYRGHCQWVLDGREATTP
jgi:hypothetical protein